MSFNANGWGFVMLKAASVTIILSICGFLLGILLGSLAATSKLSKSSFLSSLSGGYINIIRGIPELVIIYIVLYETSPILTRIASFFGSTTPIFLPAFAIGILALGVISGAYLAEVLRAAYLSIHKGELEAAQAMGMPVLLRFRRIIVPQVLRYAMPGIGNIWQFVLKESALVSVVGIVEIMKQAQKGAGATRQTFSFYITAALLYIIIVVFSSFLFRRLEKWSTKGMRRA